MAVITFRDTGTYTGTCTLLEIVTTWLISLAIMQCKAKLYLQEAVDPSKLVKEVQFDWNMTPGHFLLTPTTFFFFCRGMQCMCK